MTIDYEVHSINQVTGYTNNNRNRQSFYPLYNHGNNGDGDFGFYTLRREPRKLSTNQQSYGSRSHYVGNEAFIALTDPKNPPYRNDLKHLQISTLCTNRDLSMLMTSGQSATEFVADISAPIHQINCLTGATQPQAAHYYGDRGWDLIHHLSLNYLDILANPSEDDENTLSSSTATLKNMLMLYAGNNPSLEKRINSIDSIYSKASHYRLPGPGPITYIRGHELHLHCDENPFVSDSLFLFGQVLSEFFQRYTSIHSVTGLRLHSHQRGELKCWKPKIGQQKPY